MTLLKQPRKYNAVNCNRIEKLIIRILYLDKTSMRVIGNINASTPAPIVAVQIGAPTPQTCNAEIPIAVAIMLTIEVL